MPKYVRVSEFTTIVLTLWVAYGALVLVGGFFDHGVWAPSASLAKLPAYLEFLVGAFILFGGGSAVWGAVAHHPMESDKWALEITGLTVGAFGWLAAAIAALALNPAQPSTYVVGTGMAAAGFARAARVARVARYTRLVKERGTL